MRVKCTCPLKPVSVTDYYRMRYGRIEYVHSHCRRWPRR